jgi:tetratricopeptide (TPR) repeat protein
MKRITLLMLIITVSAAYAQKPVKPNLPKTLSMLQEGKVAEAKAMIDAATTYEKTMNEGKTWYYRGLIYGVIDTTASLRSLDPDALTVSIASFKKADEIDKEGKNYFTTDKTMNVQTKDSQIETFANYYLSKGIEAIQADEPDYEGSIAALGKNIRIFESIMGRPYSNDTLAYYVLGLATYNAEKLDEAIDAMRKYVDKGGKRKDAYVIMYQIYNGPKDNKEKALEVVREAKVKLPNNSDFPRIEIGLLIDLNRVGEAKDGLEKAVAKEPNDKILRFYLGYANQQMKNYDEAKKQYQEALRIDPAYFEAQYYYTSIFLLDVEEYTKKINDLGISAADQKKKTDLYQARVKKSEEIIPMLEKLDHMKTSDKELQIDVLEKLKLLYYYTADDAKTKAVTAKLKMLGVSDE